MLRLAEKCGINQEMDETQLDIIDMLEPLNIEARYPSYKDRLIASLNKEKCEVLIKQTDDLRLWIKNKL